MNILTLEQHRVDASLEWRLPSSAALIATRTTYALVLLSGGNITIGRVGSDGSKY
jgi:hypothetical protein